MIPTPPNTHLELVERFAAAGKHILLEKPLERSTERALRLVETAEAAGVKLGVVFQHRFREASQDAGRAAPPTRFEQDVLPVLRAEVSERSARRGIAASRPRRRACGDASGKLRPCRSGRR